MKPLRTLLLATVLGTSVGFAYLEHGTAVELRSVVSDVDAHVMLPAPLAARVMSLGYSELAADLVWIRALIYYGDGLVHHTGMPDVEQLVRLINILDPLFRRPYLWGAYATTFRRQTATEDEYRSSVDVLRRAVVAFPNDWELNWLLGLRLYFDLKIGAADELARNRQEAVTYIERAMHAPDAPQDIAIMASTMRTQLGQKERALRELREMILNTDDANARAQLQRRYALLASDMASNELMTEARKFDSAWKGDLPYVSRTFYVLAGQRPSPATELEHLLPADRWVDGIDVADEVKQ
jgi:tetratricopeptide (TPR) repeat protein